MASGLSIPRGATSPSITDQIIVNGLAQDITGATVRFRMRPRLSSTLKVDAVATITAASTGSVRYDWVAADTDTAGEYMFWWRVTLSGSAILETPESLIVVDEHTPGIGTTTGAVAERVRQKIPVTYDALAREDRYGESLIQGTIDTVKFLFFSTNVSALLEATSYTPIQLDYLAKVATVNIIPGAIDYWTEKPTNITTTGTNETESFPDRVEALWKTYEKLMSEINRDSYLVPLPAREKLALAGVQGDQSFITADPRSIGPLSITVWDLPFTRTRWE